MGWTSIKGQSCRNTICKIMRRCSAKNIVLNFTKVLCQPLQICILTFVTQVPRSSQAHFHETTFTKSQSCHLAHSCLVNTILLVNPSFEFHPLHGAFLGHFNPCWFPLTLFYTWYLFWPLDFYHVYFFALLQLLFI